AATKVNAHEIRLAPPAACAGVTSTAVGHDEASAWFAAEHRTLVEAVVQAAEVGLDAQACSLASAASTYFDLYGHWHDWIRVQAVAAAAADRLRDGAHLAQAHHSLAVACNKLRLDDDAD